MIDFVVDKSRVSYGYYEIKAPLIKPSVLSKDGVGKELSDGYALNFAIGCTHGCRFCYVDAIHKRFTLSRLNDNAIAKPWGMYMLIPTKDSFKDALSKTPCYRWKGKEVMLSSTHDPYLPELTEYTREILEKTLPYGIKFCMQTRSLLVRKDFDLLVKYRDQIRLQYSIATLDLRLSKLIEPRVPTPDARLNVLKEASELGLKVGVIIAPIFPTEGWKEDLESIFSKLSTIKGITVYGEVLHKRGYNLKYIKESNVNLLPIPDFDKVVGEYFTQLLVKYNLQGRYWYDR